ncbi:DMT family transporter [Mesorhizobium sp. PUT5]|uniref:DMT family transporter n=1 Tax=Mesorhizobium sp. PUT5 TaxID=3454629 RepID=UPI003FA45446
MSVQSSTEPAAFQRQASRPADHAFGPRDYGLYALTVIAWSASWFAIRLQVGTVPNEVNLVWRFAIATVLMLAWVVVSKRRIRFPLRDHIRFAALGVLMFSSNFLFFYYGAGYLVSGLLSVVFSLASVVNIMLAALVLRERPSPRVLAGGILGFCGIALMFAPEITAHGLSGGTMIGLALCVAGTLCFCLGNQISAAGLRKGLPLIPMSAWGMVYGTLWSALLAVLLGRPFIIEPTISYLGSLLFLAGRRVLGLPDAAFTHRPGARRLRDGAVPHLRASALDRAGGLPVDHLRPRWACLRGHRQRAGHPRRQTVTTPGGFHQPGMIWLGLVRFMRA